MPVQPEPAKSSPSETSETSVNLEVGDTFWIEPKYTGLGKPYWFEVVSIKDGVWSLKMIGEYIDGL